MKEFLLILLFGKSVLLTPVPVVLHGSMELQPEAPIEAITSGASIQIDVSSIVSWDTKEGILEFRQRLKKQFPPGSIKAELFGDGNKKTTLTYKGNHLFNKDSVMLSLYGDNGVPTDVEFKKVILTSSIELKGVKVLWKNHKQ